jgi:hypothetical protein
MCKESTTCPDKCDIEENSFSRAATSQMKGNNMSNNDFVSVSTRRGFVNAVAAAGGAGLLARLGISPALAVGATGRAEKPLKAGFSNAGLQATWCAQGKRATEYWGKVFNVDVTWFDGELSPTKQRKAIDNMATQKWDFLAIQALTEGTLTDPRQQDDCRRNPRSFNRHVDRTVRSGQRAYAVDPG